MLARLLKDVELKYFTVWLFSRLAVFTLAISPAPALYSELYQPFIEAFLANPTIDPWTLWAKDGEAASAFPYGWPMVLFFSIAHLFQLTDAGAWAFFLFTVLLLDLVVFLLFCHYFLEEQDKNSFFKYSLILSPLPLVALGFLGSNDTFPLILLVLALVGVKKRNALLAGSLFGMAVGTKIILIICIVAFVLYSVREIKNGKFLAKFALSFITTGGLSLSPIVYSSGFRLAVISSDDATGALSWGLTSLNGQILLLPIVVIGSWFATYQLKRMNYDLFLLSVAGPLLVIGAVPGAPLGWTLWALPVILYLSAKLPPRFKVLSVVASNSPLAPLMISAMDQTESLPLYKVLTDLAATASALSAVIAFLLLWREHVTRGDFVRLHSKPALILISGDSGVGKDTLAGGLSRILGEDSCVHISGDDYHRWDRNQGAWNFLTHLNPSANDLSKYFNDVLTLSVGGEIRNGHYDHRIGRRLSSRTAKSREFVFASGLHSMYVADVNRRATLKIYLQMSDELREFLKLTRDTNVRGHKPEYVIKSIQARTPDSIKFIHPQKLSADLVISSEFSEGNSSRDLKHLRFSFTSEPKIFDEQLISELVMTCGLEVSNLNTDGMRTIAVEGETNPIALETAFRRLEPRVSAILPPDSPWKSGGSSVIEMISMVYLSSALRQERLI